ALAVLVTVRVHAIPFGQYLHADASDCTELNVERTLHATSPRIDDCSVTRRAAYLADDSLDLLVFDHRSRLERRERFEQQIDLRLRWNAAEKYLRFVCLRHVHSFVVHCTLALPGLALPRRAVPRRALPRPG